MKNVKIYSTPGCPFCVRAKQFLSDNNVPYEDVDVSQDPAQAREMVDKSGQIGVPVLDIGGELIVGFDREKIKQALGI